MESRETDAGVSGLRTSAERDAFAAGTYYARVHDLAEPPETAYLDALGSARSGVLDRFVRGLLRGAPVGLPDSRLVAPDALADPDDPEPLPGVDGGRPPTAARSLPDECRHVALLPFPASETVVVAPITARHGYDRFRLAGPIRQWTPEAAETVDVAPVEHPVDLVPLLDREGAFVDADQADRVRAEVAESVANLALAQLARPVLAAGVDAAAGSPLDAVADGVPAADSAVAFERVVTDGHPFHPGAKIRRGMSAADGLAYAPEFTDRVDLRFVAVRRDHALETRAGDADRFTDRLHATFGGLADALDRALPGARDPGEYAVVPVHPWQYRHTILERYGGERADDRVVPVPEYTHPATPQLNLRTVVPYATERTGDGPLPHLKLAIDVQTTNVVRTLSPHAVTNGPRVTDVAAAIESAESLETLGLLAEPAATCYFAPGGPHVDGEAFDDARHLSALVRANPRSHPLVPDGARPVVASSLLADATGSDRPLVGELVDRYAAGTDTTSTADAALAFVDEYARVVVPEQLLLLAKYGVALESHLQNSLVVFDGARPVATLVRDFGGIRAHRGRLADRGLAVEPYPDSDLDADGEDDLYAKLYYALFQNHLAELVAAVCHDLDADEAACWARVGSACERAFERIASEAAVPEERVRRDERALFEEPTVHKALTAMRLRGKRHEYLTSRVPNPLAPAGRRKSDG